MREVIVQAPAHLHAGNLDLTGDLGRLYGTVGFAIDRAVEISARKADEVKADDELAYQYAKRLVKKFGVKGVDITVRGRIPASVGLGYNTTLALSIGFSISRLYDLNLKVEEVALAAKRGAITALGVYAFKVGGFIVEGGFKINQRERTIPPLIFNAAVPEDWFFVIVIPREPLLKIIKMRSGENLILKDLEMMQKSLSDELCRIILIKVIPAIIERDLENFGNGLTLFNRKLGEYWQKYQGGIYCHPIVEEGIKMMLSKSNCACQSSWGPTFYSIVKGEYVAKELVRELKEFLGNRGGGEVFYVRANNEGARVWEA